MGTASKFLASLVVLGGVSSFTMLFLLDDNFRLLFWQLLGRNILYASIGAIGVFASIVALGSWLWNR